VIEALSHAVPIVTTPTGAEGILEAETAMHIVSPDRFAEDLVAIYNDLDRLGALVARGSHIIEKYYSVAALRKVFAREVRFDSNAL
jgi:hypothetical protein